MKKLQYPIRAVSKLTGLSIDTLRAWERRYQAVQPRRDDRGRLYTEADIARLQLLRAAVERGHAIGRIAHLGDSQLRALLSQTPASSSPAAAEGEEAPGSAGLSRILDAVHRFDDRAADFELGRLALLLPPRELVLRVALPLMRSVGSGWEQGRLSVAQEHLVSALLRNLLGTLMRYPSPNGSTGRMLFATPSGELHEFGILAAALLAAGSGVGVAYLGPNLPPEEIVAAANEIGVRIVVLGMMGTNGVRQSIHNLSRITELLAKDKELWVGGAKSEELMQAIVESRARWIGSFEEFEGEVQRLKRRGR